MDLEVGEHLIFTERASLELCIVARIVKNGKPKRYEIKLIEDGLHVDLEMDKEDEWYRQYVFGLEDGELAKQDVHRRQQNLIDNWKAEWPISDKDKLMQQLFDLWKEVDRYTYGRNVSPKAVDQINQHKSQIMAERIREYFGVDLTIRT